MIDNLLVRIHFIIEMIWWTGLASWEFECCCPGRLIATFLYTQGILQKSLDRAKEGVQGGEDFVQRADQHDIDRYFSANMARTRRSRVH